ncbi:glycosyltransferase family 2 protein [Pelotalea chapellei]|uniref:Glycosyltransferase family 2 protein n=1 Tax=Pelotalea chapellei TaxID=44671 RepID=A0ABS5U844_9BACT|nr:glycosyltransferase family 2 protein [Pelotalea chapellei]MBT1071832.1 glycosyltransferase family 2 protein [Pelotalea chapellei]
MISVIIPAYNAEAHISEAIASVQSQSFKDYEIIVVNDGSTDGTAQIIRQQFPNVRFFFIRNSGVAAARNFGISVSKGEFVAFLDADDRWLPDKLEKQVALFDDARVGMVFTENLFFNSGGITAERAHKRERLMSGDLVRNIFLNSYVVTSTVMIRKSVLDDVGCFEEELMVAEDDNLWMRIAMNYGVKLLDEPLVLYHLTEGSLSRTRGNIMPAIRAHIELLQKKYPEILNRIGVRAIKLKYNDLYFSEGYHHFSQEKYQEARGHFLRSFVFCPWKIKSLVYALASFLPPAVIGVVKGVKRATGRHDLTQKGMELAEKGATDEGA